MSPDERRLLEHLVATRDRHFMRKASGGSRHLTTCMRGMWTGSRERYVDTGDGAGWGIPCSPHCQADRAAFDAAEAYLAETAVPEPTQMTWLEVAS